MNSELKKNVKQFVAKNKDIIFIEESDEEDQQQIQEKQENEQKEEETKEEIPYV